MNIGLRGLVVLLGLSLLGCGQPTTPSSAPTVASTESRGAQTRLPTLRLFLGTNEMKAELAATADQIQRGMMFRTSMGENEGMLFIFSRPHRAAFWMKNTIVPLSGAYIDPEGVIREIHDMKPKDETSIEAATDQVQFVLEAPQGWFERHQVGVGTLVRTERGSLQMTFFGRE